MHMTGLSIEDAWIKAAVEHRLVTVTYLNPETRLVYTKRDVRPEFIGPDRTGSAALWGIFNHVPQVGMKSFLPQNFQFFQVTESRFSADPNGKWRDLVPQYEERRLADVAL
ncbi:MAG TPA: hypothetical protein VI997_10800 [Candidatus Thermoplasmatota archaeon]|nr:hypothetical protein [Candidatus Thermoplasmatota archaeon]